jgi:hypothetical protein
MELYILQPRTPARDPHFLMGLTPALDGDSVLCLRLRCLEVSRFREVSSSLFKQGRVLAPADVGQLSRFACTLNRPMQLEIVALIQDDIATVS